MYVINPELLLTSERTLAECLSSDYLFSKPWRPVLENRNIVYKLMSSIFEKVSMISCPTDLGYESRIHWRILKMDDASGRKCNSSNISHSVH